jgi:hypothetical protein
MPLTSIHPRAFSRTDAIVALCVLVAIIGLGAAGLSFIRQQAIQSANRSIMRSTHQSMVLYAQSNNSHLPGLNSVGNLLPANAREFSAIPGNNLTGASIAARYYILLNGSFIAGDMLLTDPDFKNKWISSTAMPTTTQMSYSALRIGSGPQSIDIGPQAGRASEWRDNANAQSILLAECNTGPSNDSNRVRSVWSSSFGSGADWRGVVVWGDNHAEFLKAPNAHLGPLSLTTKYANIINTNDFLFSSDTLPGKSSTASAMFGYTSEDF